MKKYDVFISYAIEDKKDVAAPLTAELRERGLNVYFVSDELSSGESLITAIHNGLEQSEYYVLILSPDYTRRWAIIESANAIRNEKKSGRKLIFPVWHRINMHQAGQLFPQLIDHYAETTFDGIAGIASNLCKGIKQQQRKHRRQKWSKAILIFLAIFLLLLSSRQFLRESSSGLPSEQDLLEIINERISKQNQVISSSLMEQQSQAGLIPLDTVKKVYNRFKNLSSSSFDYFHFTNGVEKIYGADDVKSIGLILSYSPHGCYGLSSSRIWELNSATTDTSFYWLVAFEDTVAPGFQIDSVFRSAADSSVHAWVSYNHNIRVVYYDLTYVFADEKLKQHVRFEGFKPKEEYILDNASGLWKIREIK